MYNIHTHTFTLDAVPDRFLPFGLVRLLAKPRLSRRMVRWLRCLIPWSDMDVFDRYAAFLSTGSATRQSDIFLKLREQYPPDTKFVVLPMDMEYMGAGKVRQPYWNQVAELEQLHGNFPNQVIPFVAADPRRPDIVQHVKRCIEAHGFRGVKIYPPLGYAPYCRVLLQVFDFCQAAGVPVIAHCSRGGVYSRTMSRDECLQRTMPTNWAGVLRSFPQLKLCLAHFGGDAEFRKYTEARDSWTLDILELMQQYENVYADVSYVAANEWSHDTIKDLCSDPVTRDRVLFGTDYYMVQAAQKSEADYRFRLLQVLGPEAFARIADINPKRYLGEPD